MSETVIDRYIEAQYLITEEQASPYKHVFGDLHWWGDPDAMPIHDQLDSMRTSKLGKQLLEVIGSYNGGMMRLGDPKEFTGTDVDASDFQDAKHATFIKSTAETLIRCDQQLADHPYVQYTAGSFPAGFGVTRYRHDSMSIYTQRISWHTVAPSRDGQLGLFPLFIDHDKSHSSEANSNYRPAIKVSDFDSRAGIPNLPINRTIITRSKDLIVYERTVKAFVYPPIETPVSRTYIDVEFENTRGI